MATVSVDIPLEDAVFSALCRRGRKKLKDLQQVHGVVMRLDRQRTMLNVVGPADSVDDVRKHITAMSGPRRTVPPALWAELMRTRTMSGSEALIDRLQTGCGCRVHIERSDHEVRIFGDGQAVAKADDLLAQFAACCGQYMVCAPEPRLLSSRTLEVLANTSGVSLRLEKDSVVILGWKESVYNAVKSIQEYVEDPLRHPLHRAEDSDSNQHSTDADTMPNSLDEPEAQVVGSGSHVPDSDGPSIPLQQQYSRRPSCDHEFQQQPPPMQEQYSHQGRQFVLQPPQLQQQQQQQINQPTLQQHAVHMLRQQPSLQQHAQRQSGPSRTACICPTCGCGRFCGNCGAVVWVVPEDLLQSMLLQAQSKGIWQGPQSMPEQGGQAGCASPSGGHVVPVCVLPAHGQLQSAASPWLPGNGGNTSMVSACMMAGASAVTNMCQQMPQHSQSIFPQDGRFVGA